MSRKRKKKEKEKSLKEGKILLKIVQHSFILGAAKLIFSSGSDRTLVRIFFFFFFLKKKKTSLENLCFTYSRVHKISEKILILRTLHENVICFHKFRCFQEVHNSECGDMHETKKHMPNI